MDFVPRLTVDADLQDHMRQEFRRVAAKMGECTQLVIVTHLFA